MGELNPVNSEYIQLQVQQEGRTQKGTLCLVRSDNLSLFRKKLSFPHVWVTKASFLE